MDSINFDIDRLHHTQYEILTEFDRVCQKYGLTYYLAFGTLLGAVRHKGFIPWDDDIDTLMPYEDFLKLEKIPSSEWRTPYFYQSNTTDVNYPLCYAKIRNSNTTLITEDLSHLDINHGVDIDIYPLLNLADDDRTRKKQYFNTKAYMLLQVNEPPKNHGKLYFLAGKLILFVIPGFVKKALKTYFLKSITQYRDTKKCYVVSGNLEAMCQVLSTAWFDHMVYVPFENGEFPVPNGAEEWLRERYGEKYMNFPPIEKRGIKLGTFVKVDLEHSYKDYRGIYYYIAGSKIRKVTNNRWVGKDS